MNRLALVISRIYKSLQKIASALKILYFSSKTSIRLIIRSTKKKLMKFLDTSKSKNTLGFDKMKTVYQMKKNSKESTDFIEILEQRLLLLMRKILQSYPLKKSKS